MPELNVHEKKSMEIYGVPFTELHQWMDAPVKINGPQHRKYRHDPKTTPKEAKQLFGKNANHACLDHIILDLEDENNKRNYSKNVSGISTILNIRLPNILYQRLIELCMFMEETKSDIVREMIQREMVDLIDLSLYKSFEEKLKEDNIIFFKNRVWDSNSVRDNISLILERDKLCRKCGSYEKLGIFHLDGNIGNFHPLNLIIICDDCLRKFQRYMIKYSNKARFAAWFSSTE